MNDKKILILIDYRDKFYSSTKVVAGSMNIERLRTLFTERGYAVEICGFSDVDLRSRAYCGRYVLYQSSEDPDLRYKDYIEDVLLGLSLSGAILIPDFYKFRAHHNKVFMETLRDLSGFEAIQNLHSRGFGTLEELHACAESIPLPAVVKQGAGSKSRGVGLGYSADNLLGLARKVSSSFSLINLRRFFGGLLSGRGYEPISNHRNKFVVQDFVEGLSGDYKVLVYQDKYYVLSRLNRENDFRASGSGRLSFPKTVPEGLLDFIEKVFTFFDVPFGSFDIAIKDSQFFLLEFQFVSFGQYAIEKSSFFFRKRAGAWQVENGTSDLEETFVESVCLYIDKHDKEKS